MSHAWILLSRSSPYCQPHRSVRSLMMSPPRRSSLPQPRSTSTRKASSSSSSSVSACTSLLQPVSVLKGVGPMMEKALADLGIFTVADFLFHFPVNVINWNAFETSVPADVPDKGTDAMLLRLTVTSFRRSFRSPYRVVCKDDRGQNVTLVFFNTSPHFPLVLDSMIGSAGRQIVVRGKIRNGFGGGYEVSNPEMRPYEPASVAINDCDDIKTRKSAVAAFLAASRTSTKNAKPNDIEVLYRCGKVPEKKLKTFIDTAISLALQVAKDDWLDASYVQSKGWESSIESIIRQHSPRSVDDLLIIKYRERLAFDELVMKQLTDIRRVQRTSDSSKTNQSTDYSVSSSFSHMTQLFRESLPYALLSDQEKALEAIYKEMADSSRMKHLLQGDVGSGKSVVAFLAMLRAIECGKVSLLLAPTEILAMQHLATFRAVIEEMQRKNPSCSVPTLGYLSGSVKGKARKQLLEDFRLGRIHGLVGTHALLSEEFLNTIDQDQAASEDLKISGDKVDKRLGLVVIDEEQRFGVEQRNILGDRANVLSMSATPIPRSHFLFLQSSYTISTLREKPKEKRTINTILVGLSRVDGIIDRIAANLPMGTKVIWVTASVNPVADHPGTSAIERYEQLSRRFPGKVGLIHGQLPFDEKERVLRSFASRPDGRDQSAVSTSPDDETETSDAPGIQILVSTTVIEVGIDVPDVSICVIDRAEQFGLSQTHQIRGRVGRGAKPKSEALDSCYCILLYNDNVSSKSSGSDFSDDSQSAKATAVEAYSVPAVDRLSVLKNCQDGFEIAEADLKLRGPGDIFGLRQTGGAAYRIASIPLHSYLVNEAMTVATRVYRATGTEGEAPGVAKASKAIKVNDRVIQSDPRENEIMINLATYAEKVEKLSQRKSRKQSQPLE